MGETSSQVTINDIPEELKPYRKLLLNAAASQVFTPGYLKEQIPDATFWPGTQQPQPQPAPPYMPPPQAPVDYSYNDNPAAGSMGGGSLGSMAAAIEQQLERAHRVGYAPGGLASAAEAIEKLLAAGDVNLGESGTPLGGYTPPMVVSPRVNIPYQIGTGTRPPAPPAPPSVTPPPGSVGGVINTQPSGVLQVGNPNPAKPPTTGGQLPPGMAPTSPPGGGGTSTTPMFTANRPANFAGAAEARDAGYNPAQYADDSVAQDLARQMGGRTVYTNPGGPIGPPPQAMVDAGGSNMHNAGLIADINRRFADDEGMRKFALENLRSEIRSYGGDTGNFAKGGIAKLAVGGFPDLNGAGSYHPSATPAPPGMTTGALNPYVPYGSQRVLSMGDQGQVGPGDTLQASNLTRNSLAGFGGMPSYFSNGEIDAGRGEDGTSSTPLGIANDIFDTSGKLAINASQNAQDMSWRNPLSSSFGSDLSRIAANPVMFQAGDISLGELTAPQLDAPQGVSTNQLTSYQMAGPKMIDPSTGQIDPAYMQGIGSGVKAGQIGWGKFTDPGVAGEYMSPYMRKVLDVQKEQANADFADSKAGRSAAAIKAGAFGGNRQAVADSIADRDNQRLLSQIEAQGNQAAFENAQGQYERDRVASMTGQSFNVDKTLTADLANQGAGLTVGAANQGAYMDAAGRNQSLNYNSQFANQQALQAANMKNLEAALGVQNLGADQSMQAQLANQSAGLRAGEANLGAALTTQNLGRTSGLTAAQANQGTRLSQNTTLLDSLAKADQLKQQADQGNFGNQLAAMGQQTNSALAANTIGQNRADLARLAQAMELQRLQQMGQAGAAVDTRTQGALDLGYQDWTNQQNYPYQQMNWYQSMLSGVPMGYNQEGVQFQKTNPLSQIAGLGTAALGAYGAYQGGR